MDREVLTGRVMTGEIDSSSGVAMPANPVPTGAPVSQLPMPPWWWFVIEHYWREHGTKLIAGVIGVAGMIVGGDPTMLELLTDTLGARAPGAVLILTAALMMYRGFENSKRKS